MKNSTQQETINQTTVSQQNAIDNLEPYMQAAEVSWPKVWAFVLHAFKETQPNKTLPNSRHH